MVVIRTKCVTNYLYTLAYINTHTRYVHTHTYLTSISDRSSSSPSMVHRLVGMPTPAPSPFCWALSPAWLLVTSSSSTSCEEEGGEERRREERGGGRRGGKGRGGEERRGEERRREEEGGEERRGEYKST